MSGTTKSELIDRLTEQFPRLQKEDCAAAVAVILDGLRDALVGGGRVEIRGFGVLYVTERGARTARNRRTGEAVAVLGKRIPGWKPGKDLRMRVDVPSERRRIATPSR